MLFFAVPLVIVVVVVVLHVCVLGVALVGSLLVAFCVRAVADGGHLIDTVVVLVLPILCQRVVVDAVRFPLSAHMARSGVACADDAELRAANEEHGSLCRWPLLSIQAFVIHV